MFMRGALACACLGLALTCAASSAGECVPQAEMSVIASKFNQFSNLAGADYCYDGSSTSGLVQAIEFMRKTPFSPAMPKSHDELFSGTFAQDWWAYFTGVSMIFTSRRVARRVWARSSTRSPIRCTFALRSYRIVLRPSTG